MTPLVDATLPDQTTTSSDIPTTSIIVRAVGPSPPVADVAPPRRGSSGSGSSGTSGTAPTDPAADSTSTTVESAGPVDTTDPSASTTTTVAAALQTVEIGSLPSGWRFPDVRPVAVSASSGLTTFTLETSSDSACVVEDEGRLLLRAVKAGTCTVTVVQPGNAAWKRAEDTATVEIGKGDPTITGAVDQSLEWRAGAFPLPLTASSNAGEVQLSTSSPDCTIDAGRLTVDTSVGSLPKTCVIRAVSPETRDLVAAATTFAVEVRGVAVPVAIDGVPVYLGTIATISAIADVPLDLGGAQPTFVALVELGACTVIVQPATSPAFMATVAYVGLPGEPRSCTVRLQAGSDRLFSGDGGVQQILEFA